ncbi:MAG TPA: hypothetical protein VGV59_21530 [Pyrinomonadaceae bacterium]|nr:hypothetical protein [Pyrinomonadaceae bacterium]
MRRVPQQHPNFYVRRERDRRALRRQALLLGCCLLLAGGFVVAARQQFAAVQYGYRSEALRRERDRLLEEQRRLRFALEQRNAPGELERAAREMGLQPARASQIGGGAQASADADADAAETVRQRESGGASQRGGASTFVGSAASSMRR